MTITELSPVISLAAFAVSLLTAWFTLFRRGAVQSTHPAIIALRYDFNQDKPPQAKIFFRALIFTTGKRGQVAESLFLRVREGSRSEEFSFWGYGNSAAELMRGSGLFVPESGVVTNHHFNPTDSSNAFLFSGGTYELELVAKLVRRKRLLSLWRVSLEVPAGVFGSSIQRSTVLFFNWSPEQSRYIVSIEEHSGFAHALSEPGA